MLHTVSALLLLSLAAHILKVQTSPVALLQKWDIREAPSSKTIEVALVEYLGPNMHSLDVRVQFSMQAYLKADYFEYLTLMLRESTYTNYFLNVQNEESNVLYSRNLWFVDSIVSLRKIISYIENDDRNAVGFYVIILYCEKTDDYKRTVKKIFQTMFNLNLVKVTVIVRLTPYDALIYNYHFFKKDQCRVVAPVLVNRIKNGRFKNLNFFQHELRNFHNCSLRVFPRNIPPYFRYNGEDVNKTDIELKGIEYTMLKVISKKLNFSLSLQLNPHCFWGDVSANGTATGPFANLRNNQTDILMGYYTYNVFRAAHFAESYSYLYTPVVIVKNRFDAKHDYWVFDPFKWKAWLCLSSFVVFSFICVKLINSEHFDAHLPSAKRRHRHMRNCSWLDVVAGVLGVSGRFIKSASRLRFFIGLWCFAFLIFNACYQSKLYQSYNHSKPSSIYTLQDLIRLNYTFLWKSPLEYKRLINSMQVPPEQVVEANMPDYIPTFEQIIDVHRNKKMATTSILGNILFYIRSNNAYHVFEILPEILVMQNICAYFQPNSYLLKPFNKVISQLISFGLIRKWLDDVNYVLNKKSKGKKQFSLDHVPKPLNMEKFKPVFLVWLAGGSIGLLVFIMENLKVRLSRKQVVGTLPARTMQWHDAQFNVKHRSTVQRIRI